ncbi:hypothetical protein ACLOJK_023376 [Asimina triloba]
METAEQNIRNQHTNLSLLTNLTTILPLPRKAKRPQKRKKHRRNISPFLRPSPFLPKTTPTSKIQHNPSLSPLPLSPPPALSLSFLMWPPWSSTATTTSHQAGPRSFSFSTFKDIISLVNDENPRSPPPQSDKTPSSPRKIACVFHRVRTAASALRSWRSTAAPNEPNPRRIVLYFTSIGVIRRTFDDCRAVRSILQGLRLAVDERDLSMHRAFRDELKASLGREEEDFDLPRVFIGDRCIGGADEIRQLHETGELKKVVEGLEGAWPGECDTCGGARFSVCGHCHGSHKCYVDKGGFQGCWLCNENGLKKEEEEEKQQQQQQELNRGDVGFHGSSCNYWAEPQRPCAGLRSGESRSILGLHGTFHKRLALKR